MESARLLAANTRGDSAVTSDTMKVDWAQPLEAVNSVTGVVLPVELVPETLYGRPYKDGTYGVDESVVGNENTFYADGSNEAGSPWTIRNKPAAAVAPVGSDEEWGPAIEVGGVRPTWLGDGEFPEKYQERTSPAGVWHNIQRSAWSYVNAIRLPANHPYYTPEATDKPAEAPLGVLTGVERLERLEAFVRRLAGGLVGDAEAVAEAKALLPVDPDLLKAREIAANHYGLAQKDGPYITGANDDFPAVRIALAGIKAGREMGK